MEVKLEWTLNWKNIWLLFLSDIVVDYNFAALHNVCPNQSKECIFIMFLVFDSKHNSPWIVFGEDTLPFVSLFLKLQQIKAFVPFSFCYYLISTRHNTHNHLPHSMIQGIINKYLGKKEKRITKRENVIKKKENNIISSTYFPILRLAVGSFH